MIHYLLAIEAIIIRHEGVAALLATAGIITLPPPGTKLSWLAIYTWLYDWLHQFSNLRRPQKPNP